MKFKHVALLAATMTCLAGSTVLAAPGESVSLKSSNADSYEVVQVVTSKDKNYYQYYNSAFKYAVDIPRTSNAADMTIGGDGCYFQDKKNNATYMAYASKNTMNFTIDELYNMDVGLNGTPKLTTNIKTKTNYAIGWTAGKTSYYHELYLQDGNQSYAAFTVTYPADKRDVFAPIIAHMSRSFNPNIKDGQQISANVQ